MVSLSRRWTPKDAMVSSGITTTRPTDNDSFTRLTRNDEKDDWLKRGVRSDAGDLYRQQDLNVTLQHDYWGSSGTGGYSDLKAHTTMLVLMRRCRMDVCSSVAIWSI